MKTHDDPLLAALLEEFTDRIEAGERLDAASFARAHPERAEEIRRLFPLLENLARLEGSRSAAEHDLEAGGSPVRALGDFRLMEEIGRGGMGIVYRAQQISLGRTVALKILPFAAVLDPRQIQRFKNEAQAAAQLHHTHIVPVYSVGCERGVHYYAMQYIDGQSLAHAIGELRRLEKRSGGPEEGKPQAGDPAPLGSPPGTTTRSAVHMRSVARLGVQAAEALDHAHELGVVHRDVKPANLLVDARAHLWLTDFGLAHCRTDAGLTLSGDIVGTLRYMSPEQALAKRVVVDQRTDVYSLGATLYELLTLEPAFDGHDRQELLRRIAFEEPRPLRKLNPAVPHDLETIVLKAMEKEPSRRYATARELAEDLARFLDDRPIAARRPNVLQRTARACRRHWKATAGAAAILFLLVAVVVLGISRYRAHTLEDLRTRTAEYERTVLAWRMKLLRWKTTLEATTGRSEKIAPSGLLIPSDLARLAPGASVEDAVNGLEAAVETLRERPEAHYYLAEALRLADRSEEAKAHVRIALERDPLFAPAFVLATELEGEELTPERARDWLSEHPAADWQKDWLEAHVAQALGRIDEAVSAYGRLIEHNRPREGELYLGAALDLHLARGLALLEGRDFRRAMGDFDVARYFGPEYLEPALLLGEAMHRAGRAQWAVEMFEELYARATSKDEAAMWISLVYIRLAEHAEALRWVRRVESAAMQRRLRGEYIMSFTSPDADWRQKGLERSRAALAAAPRDIDAHLTLMSCLLWNWFNGQGTGEEVVDLCEKALDLDPESAHAHAYLALAHLWQGRPERALELVAELGALPQRDYSTDWAENHIFWVTGRNAELAKGLDRQEDEDPAPRHDADRFGFRAELLARQGRYRQAIEEYEKALERKPIGWCARGRCQLFHRLGDFEQAAACFREAEANGYGGVQGLARALVELGKPAEAVAALCESIAAEPSGAMNHVMLLRLVREHGDQTLPDDLEDVVRALQEACEKPGADGSLWRTLAFLRLHGRDGGEEAIAEARDAIGHPLGGEKDAETLATLAEVDHAEGKDGLAFWRLERALEHKGATRAQRALLDRWRSDVLPALPSLASVDAALASCDTGRDDDRKLLENLTVNPEERAEERARSYLEARLLQRSGAFAAAAEKHRALSEDLQGTDPEPHVRLSECLVRSGDPKEAEAYLRSVLEKRKWLRRGLWYAWLDVALGELAWSPCECLQRFPSRSDDDRAEDLEWLLEALVSSGTIRIDCGRRRYVPVPAGVPWGEDRFYRGGTSPRILPTVLKEGRSLQSDEAVVFQTSREFDRYEDRPGYEIPLRRGRYTVTLYFCEGWAGAPGVRVFDVFIEGEKALAAYDGYARDGFGELASCSRTVHVEDGLLEIEFRTRKNGAAVAAIEVRPAE